MSIRGAILGLLQEGPKTGYEIAKRFEHSLSRIWPVRSNQIYTELNKCAAEGLVDEIERGARNTRRYALSESGLEWLQGWLSDRSPPEQQLRFEGLLKANFIDALEEGTKTVFLREELNFWTSQRSWLVEQMKHLPPSDDAAVISRKRAAEAGVAVYQAMIELYEAHLSAAKDK